MKVLVYGAGVIGGQIIHTICACGHDVTVVARGAWAETLRENGLRIHHYIQRKLLLNASEDAYGLLMRLGYPVRPVGDERSFRGGMQIAMEGVIYAMAKTKIGALCTTEHCKNAPQEMEDLDAAFMALREKAPDFPMPSFDRLRGMMSWETVHETYGGAK